MNTSNTNILFVGGGKMMQAIAGGLMAGGASAENWCVIEPDAGIRQHLQTIGLSALAQLTDEIDVDATQIIVLATKPQVLKEAILPLAGKLAHQVVISIAAGIRTADINRWLGDYPMIVRTMPNTPALIHAGITGLYASAAVSQAQKAAAQQLMGSVGKTIWFDEETRLDAVTAVSGSGPAYVFYFIEALEQAAMETGFSAADARTFALETFRGAALLAADSTLSPAALRANVTSPNGTTEAAIAAFDAAQLQARFVAGVRAAEARSRELGDLLGAQ